MHSRTAGLRSLRRGFLRGLVILVPWLWLGLPALALDPARPLSTLAHRLWRSEDGLLQDTASALLETRDGFLWIGTQAGLVRFDGATFEHYSRANLPGFAHNEIQCLAEGRDGALWIGTSEPGLYRLQGGVLRALGPEEGLPDQPIQCLLRDRSGTLWAAPAEGPLLRFDGGRCQPVASEAVRLRIRALAEDAEGTLWVGTAGSGLWRLRKGRLTLAALTAADITALEVARDGTIMAGTRSQGLLVWTEGRLEAPSWARQLPARPVRSLFLDREGSLWIGLEQAGLFRRTREGRLESAPAALGSRWTPPALLEDSSGALWAGSEGRGLRVLYPVPFQQVTVEDADPEEPVRMVCQDSQGVVWCLRGDQGLGRIREGRVARVGPGIPPGGGISSLWPRRAGGLWVGTRAGDLCTIDQGRFRPVPWPAPPGSEGILALYEDPSETLWVATSTGGLVRLAPGSPPLRFPGAQDVLAMAGGGGGPLYLASRSRGLGLLESGRLRWLGRAEGLRSSGALSLLLDGEGCLWVGTADGLRVFREGVLASFADQSGPPPLAIHAILEDPMGRLWLGTGRGVFRLPRAALLRSLDEPGPIQAVFLDHHDGLPSRETAGGAAPAAWLTGEGDLYVPTGRGLARLDSRIETPPGAPLRLHVLRTEGDQVVLPERPLVQVPAGTHRLEVHYTATSLTRADKIRFRYRLDGWEPSWNEVGDRRFAAYSNLPPGRYRFVLQAWRLDEDDPPQERSFEILVRPFFYQRPLFWVLVLLGAAAFAGWLHRLRLQQLEARSAVLSERNRMAREIHDHLAQGFTGVLLQLESAEARLAGMEGDPAPVLSRLARARDLAAASLQEARRSVLALRPRRPEGTDLLGALRLMADRLLAGTDIRVELALVGHPRPLGDRLEEELIRMAQELLTNALRHGKARWVRVVLEFERRRVRLSVDDDGLGFDPSAGAAGYGLRSIRESLEQLRGRLDIDSSQGLGSRITLTLPIRRWRL